MEFLAKISSTSLIIAKKKKPETRSAMKRWKIPLELKCEEKKFNGAAKEILAHVEWHYMWATNLKLAYICLGRL